MDGVARVPLDLIKVPPHLQSPVRETPMSGRHEVWGGGLRTLTGYFRTLKLLESETPQGGAANTLLPVTAILIGD